MPAAAVLLRHRDAEVAQPADLVPQLLGLLAGPGLRHEVAVAVAASDCRDRPPQQRLFVGLGEIHQGVSPSVSASGLTTASTAPVSTCDPAATRSCATVPATGAATTCSIFIASR